MPNKSGYVLLGMLLFFTFIGLSSSVTVLEQDTRLKRFSEDDLRQDLGAIRRGIDLYRYQLAKSGSSDPAFEDAINNGSMTTLIQILIDKNMVRPSVASGTAPWRQNIRKWRKISNLITNPSFEIDDGSILIEAGSWRGNFTANDGVPDGWTLTSGGADQHIAITEVATYVISFWARADTPTSRARVRVWRIAPIAEGIAACDLTADETNWKRYFGNFQINSVPAVVRLELVQAGSSSGDTVYLDGLMLEKWNPPAGTPAAATPAPSAWTKDYTITPLATESAQQQRLFRELIPEGANPASYSWWFNW
ncbi:MAG: hypothetical protein CVV42_10080 [Candidatus Riflebacteria bacterium HGW-Riflebacteria-2]|jgi:hypothetical protein|nr:MAG: hypothetical protein CVV42_10080 [Candidatus Riflebacteria bacterium HGW-Riflebacteria-2]